jgi:hypothetical protein
MAGGQTRWRVPRAALRCARLVQIDVADVERHRIVQQTSAPALVEFGLHLAKLLIVLRDARITAAPFKIKVL